MQKIDSIRLKPLLAPSQVEAIQTFAKDTLVPFENASRDSQEFDPEIVEGLFRLGVLQMGVPKKLGGPATPVADLVWVIREIAVGSPSVAATVIGHLLGCSAITLYGQPSVVERVSRECLSRTLLFSFGMTEADVGSDVHHTKTQARRVDGGYILNGEKNFITNAGFSSHLAIFAQVVDEQGMPQGVSCFYVPGDSQGLVRGPQVMKIGWKRANTGTLYFHEMFVPSEHLLGEEGQGVKILMHCLGRSKTMLAAMGVGISQRAYELSTERLVTTERFGKSLLEQPAIRHLIARLAIKMEAAWLLTCKAAATWDAGLSATEECSMAKHMAGTTAVEMASQAAELFGARGLTLDYEISRLMSDAKAVEIVEGPSLVQELLISKEIFKSKGKANASRPSTVNNANVVPVQPRTKQGGKAA